MRVLEAITAVAAFGIAAARLPAFALTQASGQGRARTDKGLYLLKTVEPGYSADIQKLFNQQGHLSIAPFALLFGGRGGRHMPDALQMARLRFFRPQVAR